MREKNGWGQPATGGSEISLSELMEMFSRAAPKWPCPDERILDECAFLHSVGWAQRWKNPDTRPRRPGYGIEKEIRKSLKNLEKHLPVLIEIYEKLAGIGSHYQFRAQILKDFRGTLPTALKVLMPERHEHARSDEWYEAATVIAREAMTAWNMADGRTQFGANPTSPLVKFTHEFLAQAGIDKTVEAIAKAFQENDIAKEFREVS